MRIEKEPVPLPGTVEDPLYPSWDGKPTGETDFHSAAILVLREALEDFYAAAGRTDVYIASNILLYYEQGVRNARRDPDVLVALDTSPHRRRSFRVWEEGRLPDVVFEIASENTHAEDTGDKFQVYQSLGIREYVLFDPEGAFYDTPLMGYHLVRGRYARLRPVEGAALPSRRLGVWLVAQGGELRLIDPATRERIEQAEEERDLAQEERDLARSEQREERLSRLRSERAARRAEDRVRELEDELRRLRGSPPG
jgi:Uma2 family endonuclease